jgi:hypothetical protein
LGLCKDVMLTPSVMNIRKLFQRLWETYKINRLEMQTNARFTCLLGSIRSLKYS